MEPVNIDFMLGGNVSAEGPKIEKSMDDITKSISDATSMIDRHKSAIVDLKKDLVELGVSYRQATKSQKSEILADIELTKKNLIDEKQAVSSLITEVKLLEKQKKSTASVSYDTTTIAHNAGKAAIGYNNLGFSVQQIVREMPAATMGLNMFFLAISNNVPILTDNIKRARAENELLKSSGQTSVPVWKQLAGSLFSWQSAMMIGITLISMYGKDILAWTEKLLTGKNGIDKTTESQKALNKVFSDFTGEASRKIESVTRIGVEIQKYGNNSENSKKIIDDFNKTFNTHLTTIEQVKNAYPGLSQAAVNAAIKIQAANSLIEKSAQAMLKKQEADTKLAPFSKKQINEVDEKMQEAFTVFGKLNVDANKLTSQFEQGIGFNPLEWMGGDEKTRALVKYFNDPEHLWFASYITQQRKYGKIMALENKEIMKMLDGVDFKDFKPDPNKPQADTEKYDAAKALQKLLLDVHDQTEKLMIQQQGDSLQKRLAAIDLEKELEKQKITEKEVAIIEAYNKAHKTSLSTKPADIVSSIGVISPGKDEKTGLTAAQTLNNEIIELDKAYAKKRVSATDKWTEELLALGVKYGDERLKIEEEYNLRIQKEDKAALDPNATPEIIAVAKKASAELAQERDKKISAVSTSLIQETDLYKMATDKQLQISKELTAALIAELEKRIQADETITSEDADKMLAKLHKADYTVNKTGNPFSDLIDGVQKYKAARLEQTKTNTQDDLEGFVLLEDAANRAQKATLEAAAGALQGIGSVIQEVVSSLDQLGVLSESDKKTANEVIGMISGAANLAQGLATGNPIAIITGSIQLLTNAYQLFDVESKKIAQRIEDDQKALEKLTEEYEKLQRLAKKSYSNEKSDVILQEIANRKKSIAEYQDVIDAENEKRDKREAKLDIPFGIGLIAYLASPDADEAKIKDAEDNIKRLKSEIADLEPTVIEALTGSSVSSAIDEFANAYADAFTTGEDAAKKSFDVVNNLFRSALIERLKQQLQPGIEEIMQMLANAMLPDSDGGTELTPEEKAAILKRKKYLDDLAAQGMSDFTDLGLNDTTAKGIQGDVKNMTEDTGSALVGQIIAMRLNVAEIVSGYKNSAEIMTKQLALQQEIADNTAFCRKLERMDNTLEYFRLNGIKMV